jgi:arginine decarboxylase
MCINLRSLPLSSGAVPIFVTPEYNPVLDLAHSITPDGVATALEQHPDAKAVMMVYPTYYGVCGDVAAIALPINTASLY